MAWAAFQVLANRCIEWEKVEGMKNLLLLTLNMCELFQFYLNNAKSQQMPSQGTSNIQPNSSQSLIKIKMQVSPIHTMPI